MNVFSPKALLKGNTLPKIGNTLPKGDKEMIKTFYLQALAFWFLLVLIAIFNAILREVVYGPLLDNELISHQVSTITAIVFLLIGFYVFLRFFAAEYRTIDTVYLGVLWMVMTVLFEFLFGHYIMEHSWDHLLSDYNLLAGRVWICVVVSTLLGPYVLDRFLLNK